MLALVRNDAIVVLVREGSTFACDTFIDIVTETEEGTSTHSEIVPAWTGPAYAGWRNDLGYELRAVIPAVVPEGHYIVSSETAFVDGEPTEIAVTAPIPRQVPYMISRKQFYMQLALMELITRGAALAAIMSGVLPDPLASIVDGMSNDDAKWEAQMQLLGANDFYRDSPWVLVVATVLAWTDEQIDDFWLEASAR